MEYEIKADALKDYWDQIQLMHKEIFSERDGKTLNQIIANEGEDFTPKVVKKEPFSLVAVNDDNHVVGWHFGEFISNGTYYMRNSAVEPNYRRIGVYSALMGRLETYLSEQGVIVIESRHHAANNAVIIAKLKRGFMIHGMDVDIQFGTVVLLRKYLRDAPKELFEKRTGYRKWN